MNCVGHVTRGTGMSGQFLCAEILCKSEGTFAFTLLGGLASPARLTCLRHMSRIHIHTPRCDLDGTFVSRFFQREQAD